MRINILSAGISHEINLLLYSLILGCIITFLYDNLRVLRRIIVHNVFFVSLEDFSFWIIVTYAVFSLQYYANKGIFRWFCIMGAFIGMSIYKLTIGRIYVNIMSKILKFLIKWAFFIIRFLLSPIFWLEEKAMGVGRKSGIKCRRIVKIMKNRLTQRAKLIKITLCKHKEIPEIKKGHR